MAYATQADMEERFGAGELLKITDRSNPPTGAIDAAVVTRALSDAEAEINGYLAARYTLPLSSTPAVLKRLCCVIARYYLYDDWANEQVRAQFEDATKVLKLIAEGKVLLGTEPAAAPETRASKPQFTTSDRVFSRGSLEEF
ncbi:MAG: DUF1320 domain-containing protein [Deltaproteobacteria bacterium]|nr:DUF1320 domain-containing protein [Deltaproteobacteria bacterium]